MSASSISTENMSTSAVTAKESEEALRYYSATQWQLIWWRFKHHKAALFAGTVLVVMGLCGLFASFLSPYSAVNRDKNYLLGPPQIIQFWDQKGFSLRPFTHGVTTKRNPTTLRREAKVDPDVRRYIEFFAHGDSYRFLGLFKTDIHLFGVDEGYLHLFGTDDLGRDLFSRTLFGTGTSMSIGIIGVVIAFILALFIGGVAGYAGGWIDYTIQRFTEIIRVIPVIPLYMGLAAAFPKEWTTMQVYFAMTLILGLVGWPTLARRIRGQILSLRDEDYIVAARVVGAGAPRIIGRHLLPAFSSYIIVDLVISFPYMVLSETALSFIGLGLRPPAVSWGVLLQAAQSIRTIQHAPWLFIPAIFVVVAVLAFTVLGDGVRDAADPYSVSGG